MTRNRNRKMKIRALAKADNLPYNVARRRLGDARQSPQIGARWNRAAETLDTARPDLMRVLAEFAALPTPSGPLAEDLVRRTLDTLDARIPFGTIETPFDLYDAATDRGHKVMPPIPTQISASMSAINDVLDTLTPDDLRTAAIGLGLLRGTAAQGAVTAAIRDRARIRRQSKELLDTIAPLEWANGYPDVGDGDHDSDRLRGSEAEVEAIIGVLAAQQTADWKPLHIAALRTAISIHLADLGDAFLRTSEHHPVTLDWHELTSAAVQLHQVMPGTNCPVTAAMQADFVLPGTARQVTAVVIAAPIEEPRRRLPLFTESGNPPVPVTAARCSVGAVDVSGKFDEYTSSREVSELSARFAASEFVTDMAEDPQQVRSQTTHRLLVPAPLGDTPSATIDLVTVLQAVGSEHDNDPDEEFTWIAHPHITSEDDLASVVALVLDASQSPLPWPEEDACQEPIGADPFEQFLTNNGVRFTDMARAYLIAQQDAGPGDLSLGARHSAGMRAVLTDFTGSQLVSELSRTQDPTEEMILSAIHVLGDLATIRHLRGVLAAYFLPAY